MLLYVCRKWEGIPRSLEGQALTWKFPHEMKALGARVRVMMKGLIALQLDLDGTQADMGFSHSESSNPLMGKMPANAKLAYLLGEHATPPGKLDPDQALADLLKRLQAHEAAMLAASRAVAVGVLTDFEPATLQALLDKEGSRMPFMGNVRLWDLYSKHYEKLGGNLRLWLQDTLSRHFAPMYSGEYEKKRK